MTHRSTKAAERREADRIRKKTERERMRLDGIPKANHVDHAIVEATSFAITHIDRRRMWDRGAGWYPINSSLIEVTAIAILVERFRADPDHAREAVQSRLAPRPEHRHPGYVPTIHPPVAPHQGMPTDPDMSAPT